MRMILSLLSSLTLTMAFAVHASPEAEPYFSPFKAHYQAFQSPSIAEMTKTRARFEKVVGSLLKAGFKPTVKELTILIAPDAFYPSEVRAAPTRAGGAKIGLSAKAKDESIESDALEVFSKESMVLPSVTYFFRSSLSLVATQKNIKRMEEIFKKFDEAGLFLSNPQLAKIRLVDYKNGENYSIWLGEGFLNINCELTDEQIERDFTRYIVN